MQPEFLRKLNAVISASAFAVVLLAAGSAVGQKTQCKDGICAHTSSTWNGKKMVKKVSFSGQPRTRQGYVTDFHQVRGLPYPYQRQEEVHQHREFELTGTHDISVQACRRTGTLIRKTYCTSWVSFKIY